MTPEGKIKAKVDRALAALPKCYKFKPVQNGMGAPGLDYYCCIGGTFVGIETKVPGGRLTERQKITARCVVQAGGVVFVIRDQADINFMIGTLKAGPIIFGDMYDALNSIARNADPGSA